MPSEYSNLFFLVHICLMCYPVLASSLKKKGLFCSCHILLLLNSNYRLNVFEKKSCSLYLLGLECGTMKLLISVCIAVLSIV